MTHKTTLIALCLVPLIGMAQPPAPKGMHPDRKKIEAMEVAYLTRELNLTPEDAQKFWPVFNKYREDIKAVNTNTAITDPLERQQKVLDLRKKYRTEFVRVLGQERGATVFTAEDQFRQMVRSAIQRRRKMAEKKPLMDKRLQERRRNSPRGAW